MTEIMVPCYESTSKQYRHQMGGGPEAAQLPQASGNGSEMWDNAAKAFRDMVHDIGETMRAAEAAHEGRAAEAANASIAELQPDLEGAAGNCDAVGSGLREQQGYQAEAFQSIPSQGETLENGREVQLSPPEKGWVENNNLHQNPFTGWMSDYEERQEDFRATNERATVAMERYDGQTQGVIDRLPHEQAPPPEAQPHKPAGDNNVRANDHLSGQSFTTPSSTPSSTPASSSSSWAPSSAGQTVAPAPPSSTPNVPAGSGSAWAPSPAPTPGNLPPGTVRGPDGTVYRKDPNTGQWQRQNPYNGRWAPAPNGPPGSGGGAARGGAGGAGAGAGARGGMAGGVGGGAAGGGAGGSAGGNQLGAGGRAGVGAPGAGGGPGGAAGGGAAGGGSAAGGARGGAGGMGGGGGARGGGGQGGDEQEHDRPSWLLENEDVFTNDMEKVAPPVFGAPEE